jgi:Uma2 family endonuclease
MNPAAPPLAAVATLRRFTTAEYHAMLTAGILYEGERVELLEGLVVEKPVKNPPHEGALKRITIRFPRLLPAGWTIQIQGVVVLSDSEPEPDGAVIRGDETAYDTRHPDARDVGIVIEVSDTSLAFDRRQKGRIYARAGIPVYWVVNVIDKQIEVYMDPDSAASPPEYRVRQDYRPGDALPITLAGSVASTIPVTDLLP